MGEYGRLEHHGMKRYFWIFGVMLDSDVVMLDSIHPASSRAACFVSCLRSPMGRIFGNAEKAIGQEIFTAVSEGNGVKQKGQLQDEASSVFWVVVSKIFYFHPYLGKIPILTNIFQRG